MDRLDEFLQFLMLLPYDEDESFARPNLVLYADGSGDVYDDDDINIISFDDFDDFIAQVYRAGDNGV